MEEILNTVIFGVSVRWLVGFAIKGAIPGPKNGIVVIADSIKA